MASFGFDSTAEDVIRTLGVNLEGKNILVTGASSGIGAEAARVFVNAGGNVWLGGRDVAKTQAVADSIIATSGKSDNVHVIEINLSSLASVQSCVNQFKSLGLPLHILLNNAGCMANQERTETVDGFEMQIGTNHFGHFLLTKGLIDSLLASGSPRVVNVSSLAHRRTAILFDDIFFTGVAHSYDPWKAYGQSKTANVLHAVELNRRYSSLGLTAVSLHPGVIETELWRHAGKIMSMNKTIPQGAATSVYCSVAAEVSGGGYYNDCKLDVCADYASNTDNARRLWELSEEATAAFA